MTFRFDCPSGIVSALRTPKQHTSASCGRLIKLCRRFGLLRTDKHFRQGSARRWPFDAKLLYLVNQSGSLEAQHCGGTIASSNDPTGRLKRPKDKRSFGVA